MRPDPASFKSWFCRMTFNVSLRLFDCSLARLNASWQAPHWLTWKLIISQKITRNEIAFLGRNWENVSLKSLVNWLLYQDLTPLIILNIIRPSRWDDKMYVGTPTSIDEQKRGVYYMLRNSRPRRTLQEQNSSLVRPSTVACATSDGTLCLQVLQSWISKLFSYINKNLRLRSYRVRLATQCNGI